VQPWIGESAALSPLLEAYDRRIQEGDEKYHALSEQVLYFSLFLSLSLSLPLSLSGKVGAGCSNTLPGAAITPDSYMKSLHVKLFGN